MTIYVFGDSHSAYCFECLVDSKIYWLGPVTMHRIARDGTAFVSQLVPRFEDGDVALFMVGEIDIRCHLIPISEARQKPIDDVAKELATGFISRLALLQKSQQHIKVVVTQPLFPTDRRPNSDLPFRGDVTTRVHAHRLLSGHLDRLCHDAGLHFLLMPSKYKDKDGVLLRKYSDDGVHMMPCEAERLVKSLGKILSKKIRFDRKPMTLLTRRWNYIWGGTLRRKGLPITKPIEMPPHDVSTQL
ncbi:hypothetical protein [Agrobacterium rubi]|uniref:Uncharacterized protein n=1 Tax=Agrobacterium rubi TaxID=28099 RepID=A0AAE7QZK9_9HYPH|nr:hypothetical protein [Agrobacterium rubi]NTE86912.1 hypothetical protein [Agrobacterium rubi]NTF02846.1 hypothetical protein [Agrobacterium rubi]NTF37090.1 hypothetical protein [Agrobacterium rubi]OCJ55321.1 hypothetical protein A6U92_01560 [Agrobacterium rubi]QTF99524.1 hypothetical protein G6M88_03500 [Agrobacterium rubi]